MIRKTKKCLSFVLIFSVIQIYFVFEVMKSKRKHCVILLASIITTIFVFKHMTQLDIKVGQNEITFVDILHQLPIKERRHYVWKKAFKIINNRAFGSNSSSAATTNNQTITHLINNTIERYKVRVVL